MATSKIESLITIPTGDYEFSLTDNSGGPYTITLAAAETYYHSSLGNQANDLAAELKTLMDAASGRTYTVTVDATVGGTGKYTISVDTGNYSITWTDTALRNLLGFTSDVSSQSTATGANQAKGLWLPAAPIWKEYGIESEGKPRSSANIQVGSDGTYYAFHGARTTRDRLRWPVVQVPRVIAAEEDTVNESWEQFFLDCIRGEAAWAVSGKSLRWYKDADTDATYQTYHAVSANEPLVARVNEDYDGLWSVELEVLGAG